MVACDHMMHPWLHSPGPFLLSSSSYSGSGVTHERANAAVRARAVRRLVYSGLRSAEMAKVMTGVPSVGTLYGSLIWSNSRGRTVFEAMTRSPARTVSSRFLQDNHMP